MNRENLSAAEAQAVMQYVLNGDATTAQLAGFLVALRMKGETADELVGFARAMREKAVKLPMPLTGDPLLDTCGTGGDGACTFNISTVAAFVVAGAGVRVAKHGNRSLASRCGSADVLQALGVDIDQDPRRMAAAIGHVGFGFFFAPAIHPAMRHAQQARAELKMRTAFNLLGPLTNPAGANVQIVGAPSIRAAELIAQALASLGLQRGFVVHGLDGLDEITTTADTFMLEIRRGAIAHHTLSPQDFGVATAKPADLKGDDIEANRKIAKAILAGELGPKRDIVLVNAAAALVVVGKAADFREGVSLAAKSIDSGAARSILQRLVEFTARPAVLAG
ncbi:MAG: anthranilate phosphoribosyltransferase, partial [Bryobacteraceae bacterium]